MITNEVPSLFLESESRLESRSDLGRWDKTYPPQLYPRRQSAPRISINTRREAFWSAAWPNEMVRRRGATTCTSWNATTKTCSAWTVVRSGTNNNIAHPISRNGAQTYAGSYRLTFNVRLSHAQQRRTRVGPVIRKKRPATGFDCLEHCATPRCTVCGRVTGYSEVNSLQSGNPAH